MEDSSRKPKKRQKLCYNCEGEVDLDVIVCPFCAADLRVEKLEKTPTFASPQKNLQDQMTSESLYAPPGKATEVSSEATQQPQEQKNIFAPTILFTLGVQLVVLGLLMLLFAHKGVVTLKWNASWWFLYSLFGCPFIYFGYKNLSKI